MAIELSALPETMLWPLWNRAAEQSRSDPLLVDPLARDLVGQLDYDFAAHFGKASVTHAIRARVCDDLIRSYAERTAAPVVVALGEGLETQLWRIAGEQLRWISVDLPEAIEFRQAVLPAHPAATLTPCSALDPSWMDDLPADAQPFITAAGLLMYFEEAQVQQLLNNIAERFDSCEVFFDTIPPFFSQRTLRGLRITDQYTAPPMPWGIRLGDVAAFVDRIPRLQPVSINTYADPFPTRLRLYHWLSYLRPIKHRFAPGLVHLRTVRD